MAKKRNFGGGASRTTAPATGTSAATDVSLREHLAQRLHDAEVRLDQRWHDLREADQRFAEERDRRYTEVKQAEEKAILIKEVGDKEALSLAREIQTYKDEKANELREQINSERGRYLTREEYNLAHVSLVDKVESGFKPLNEFMTSQLGRREGIGISTGVLVGSITVLGAIIGIVVVLANVLTK